jgi:hypothetical protein
MSPMRGSERRRAPRLIACEGRPNDLFVLEAAREMNRDSILSVTVIISL